MIKQIKVFSVLFLALMINVSAVAQSEKIQNITNDNSIQENDELTIEEMDLFREQLKNRWIPRGVDNDIQGLTVDILVKLNSDGTIQDAKIVGSNLPLNNTSSEMFAESALEAVKRVKALKIQKKRKVSNFTVTFSVGEVQ